MYKSFSIKDFRCFSDLKIEGLSRINLLTGSNNVGKTAFLEAIFLHAGSFNPDLVGVINSMRGIANVHIDLNVSDDPFANVFRNFDTTQPIRLHGQWDNRAWDVLLSTVSDGAEVSGLSLSTRRTFEKASAFSSKLPARILKLEYRPPKGASQRYYLILDPKGKRIEPTPPVAAHTTRFHLARARGDGKEETRNFSSILIRGEIDVDMFVEALKIIEPRLRKVEIAIEGGDPLLHGDIGMPHHRLIPFAMMGDGIGRLAGLLLNIATTRDGVLLVDEIEIGWYHKTLPAVWKAIASFAAHYNCQLFCTTHSRECVAAAHEAVSQSADPAQMALFRFERIDGVVRAFGYDFEMLDAALETSLEVR